MSHAVVVVAVGARTPVGLTAESSAAAVRAGISRVCEGPLASYAQAALIKGAIDARLDPNLRGPSRLVPLAAAALGNVHAKLTGFGPQAQRLSVLLALPETRPGFTDADARDALVAFAREPSIAAFDPSIEPCGRGHAGAFLALHHAAERVAQGRSEVVVVGGVDTYFETATLDWLLSQRRLAAEGVRSGFAAGEGAGFMALASWATARRLDWPVLATLRGVGTSTEKHISSGDDEVLGEGLAEAIGRATSTLRLPDEAVDSVFCDINGERYRSQEWGFAVLRMQRSLRDLAYEAPADCWADVGAAWGALGCVLAVQSWAGHYARGPRALVWGSSDGGLRGAAVLEQGS